MDGRHTRANYAQYPGADSNDQGSAYPPYDHQLSYLSPSQLAHQLPISDEYPSDQDPYSSVSGAYPFTDHPGLQSSSQDSMDPLLTSLITLHSFRNGGQIFPPSSSRAISKTPSRSDKLRRKFLDRLAEILAIQRTVVTALVDNSVWIAVEGREIDGRDEAFLRRLEEYQLFSGAADVTAKELFWDAILDYACPDLTVALLPNVLGSLGLLLGQPYETKHPSPIFKGLQSFYASINNEERTTGELIVLAYEFTTSKAMREYFALHSREKPYLKVWESICALSRLRGAHQTMIKILPSLPGVQIHIIPTSPPLPKPTPLSLSPLLSLLSLPPTVQTIHRYINRAAANFSEIAKRFETTLSLSSRVHPEITAFVFLSHHAPRNAFIFPYLGTSSPSCALCSHFLWTAQEVPTRGTTGKVHSGWSLPSTAFSQAGGMEVDGLHEALEDMKEMLRNRALIPITNGLGTITESASGFGETIGTGSPLSFSSVTDTIHSRASSVPFGMDERDSNTPSRGRFGFGAGAAGGRDSITPTRQTARFGSARLGSTSRLSLPLTMGREGRDEPEQERAAHIDFAGAGNGLNRMPTAVRRVEEDLRMSPVGQNALEFPKFSLDSQMHRYADGVFPPPSGAEEQDWIPEGRASNHFVSTPAVPGEYPPEKEKQKAEGGSAGEDVATVAKRAMSLKRLFTWGRKRKESLPLGTVKEESERADSRLENLKEREAALSRTTLTLNRKESRTDGRLTRNESRNEGRMMRNDSRDEGRMMRNDSRDEGRMMRNDSRDEGHDDYGMAAKRADAAYTPGVISTERATSDEILRAYREGAAVHADELREINTAVHTYSDATNRVKDVQTSLLESMARLYQLMQQSQGKTGSEYKTVLEGVRFLTKELELLKGQVTLLEIQREERREAERAERRAREMKEREKEELVRMQLEERMRKESEMQHEVERLQQQINEQHQVNQQRQFFQPSFGHVQPTHDADDPISPNNFDPHMFDTPDQMEQQREEEFMEQPARPEWDAKAEEKRQRRLSRAEKKRALLEMMEQILAEREELFRRTASTPSSDASSTETPVTLPNSRRPSHQLRKASSASAVPERQGKRSKKEKNKDRSRGMVKVTEPAPSIHSSVITDRPFNVDSWIPQQPLPMPLPRRPKPEKTKQRKISTPGPSSNGNGLRKRKLSIRGLFGPSRGADATEHAERWGKTVKNGDGKKESMGDAGAAMVKQLAQYRAAKEAAQAQVAANQYGQGGHELNPEFTVGSLLYRLSTELEGVDDIQQRRMIIDEILKKSPPELQFPTQQSEVQPEQHARQMRSNMTLEERFHKEGIEPGEEPLSFPMPGTSVAGERFKKLADWKDEDLDGLIEEFNRLSAIEQIANNLQHMRNMA